MKEKQKEKTKEKVSEKKKDPTTFDTLFEVNVNDHVEKKNGLSYLSWAYAWADIKKRYPNATYEIKRFGENNLPYVYDQNTGYMVFTSTTIRVRDDKRGNYPLKNCIRILLIQLRSILMLKSKQRN